MRVVVQRVSEASVDVVEDGKNRRTGSIGAGFVVLLAVENGDCISDAQYLAQKIVSMRVFEDSDGKMNLSLGQIGGEILLVSQFTLYASTVRGNRPSYIRAAKPAVSEPLYEKFCKVLEEYSGKSVKRGIFGADMKVSLLNDGPVTIIIDSKTKE